jgi:hypothetical protein
MPRKMSLTRFLETLSSIKGWKMRDEGIRCRNGQDCPVTAVARKLKVGSFAQHEYNAAGEALNFALASEVAWAADFDTVNPKISRLRKRLLAATRLKEKAS